MKKNHNGLLFTTSNEYIWPKMFLIFMHGNFWTIFNKISHILLYVMELNVDSRRPAGNSLHFQMPKMPFCLVITYM